MTKISEFYSTDIGRNVRKAVGNVLSSVVVGATIAASAMPSSAMAGIGSVRVGVVSPRTPETTPQDVSRLETMLQPLKEARERYRELLEGYVLLGEDLSAAVYDDASEITGKQQVELFRDVVMNHFERERHLRDEVREMEEFDKSVPASFAPDRPSVEQVYGGYAAGNDVMKQAIEDLTTDLYIIVTTADMGGNDVDAALVSFGNFVQKMEAYVENDGGVVEAKGP